MKNYIVIGLFAFTFFASCEKEEFQEKEINTELENTVEVTSQLNEKEAKTILSTILHKEKGKSNSYKSRNPKSVIPLSGQDTKTKFYLANYDEGGFVLLSSDKRVNPILAFSDEGNFPTDLDNYPSGLVSWLKSGDEYITGIQNGEITPKEGVEELWNEEVLNTAIIDQERAQKTDTEVVEIISIFDSPILLSTNWSQQGGFNDGISSIGCSSSDGRPPSGCVAIAMAQIMKYHEHPSNYNWSNMPNTFATSSTAALIKDIGDAVNMDYGCDGSGSNTKDDGLPAMKNTFGYSSAKYGSYSFYTAKANLDQGLPLILSGADYDDWFFFRVRKDGHAWITDGYRIYTLRLKRTIARGRTIYITVENNFLHMNWGWGRSDLNGYFNHWSVEGNDFSYEPEMMYDIKP
ncbi:C10 family peptidase [Aquimarina pacifica]|uniref:C10 family peptidase n=1 Tax=Aquimarina pacifica TaxID=1296415 RepID=UPI000470515F|nr:C10 family peptidase [Aquimarina pacifica]